MPQPLETKYTASGQQLHDVRAEILLNNITISTGSAETSDTGSIGPMVVPFIIIPFVGSATCCSLFIGTLAFFENLKSMP